MFAPVPAAAFTLVEVLRLSESVAVEMRSSETEINTASGDAARECENVRQASTRVDTRLGHHRFARRGFPVARRLYVTDRSLVGESKI